MRKIATTLALVGLAATSVQAAGLTFADTKFFGLDSIVQQTDAKPTYDVVFNIQTGSAGTFLIGGNKDKINLRPQMNLDYTFISASNCT